MEFLTAGGNIVLVAIGFGLLIFIHELGHFCAAKWAGIRTQAFAIGFGPPIISWRRGVGWCRGSTERVIVRRCGRTTLQMTDRELEEEGLGETEYSIRWLPLGGFVRMLGQDDLDPARRVNAPRSFNAVSIGRRMVVISAGVIMNVLLAIVCFIIAFSIGVPVEAPVIGDVAPGSPAAAAVPLSGGSVVGLRPGDRVTAIDGEPVETFVDLQVAAGMSVEGQQLAIEVDRPGAASPLTYGVVPEESPSTGMRGIGIMPASSLTLTDDRSIQDLLRLRLEAMGAGWEGIGPGWTLASLDGTAVSNWGDLERLIDEANGAPQQGIWSSGDASRHVTIQGRPSWQALRYPDATHETAVGWEEGLCGFVPPVQIERIESGSPNAGLLQQGDVVLRVGQVVAPRMRAFREALASARGDTIAMRVVRDGQTIDLEARLERSLAGGPPKAGVYPGYAWAGTLLAAPMSEVGTETRGTTQTLAASIPDGLLPASRWVSVNGRPVTDWRDVWTGFRSAAAAGAEVLTLEFENPAPARQRRRIELPLSAQVREGLAELEWNPPLASYLFAPIRVVRRSGGNPLLAMSMGAEETWRFIELTYLTIDRLIRGSVGVDQLHGPVGIVHLGARVADRGIAWMLFFLAIISVNLAVLNFLPLPIVDGGMFLYLVYEKLRGQPPPAAFQNAAMLVGLLLIGTAFFVTFYNDLVRLIG